MKFQITPKFDPLLAILFKVIAVQAPRKTTPDDDDDDDEEELNAAYQRLNDDEAKRNDL